MLTVALYDFKNFQVCEQKEIRKTYKNVDNELASIINNFFLTHVMMTTAMYCSKVVKGMNVVQH